MRTKLVLIALLLLVCTIPAARADQTWTYIGNDMNGYGLGNLPPSIEPPLAADCHCALTGTFTLNTTLADYNNIPLSWSFTDGTHTLNQFNSVADFDATQPFGWFLSVSNGSVNFLSSFYGSQIETTDSVLVNGSLWAIAESNHGRLAEVVATPEPGTLALLAVGLMGLLACKRSKPAISTNWEPLA